MNTMNRTQTIWISNNVPNLQNNRDEIIWCKTIDDAKNTIQSREITTINCRFSETVNIYDVPINKIIVEDP